MATSIQRLPIVFLPDAKRVVVKFFMPHSKENALKTINRIAAMQEEDALQVLNQTLRDFSSRHRNITRTFLKHFEKIAPLVEQAGVDAIFFSRERKLLVGAYFSKETAIEAVGFFNPSMVEDPDQSHLEQGQKRVIVSCSAQSEGDMSLISFRSAVLDKNNNLEFTPVSKLVDVAEGVQAKEFNKATFRKKLGEMDLEDKATIEKILSPLHGIFLLKELHQSINTFLTEQPLTVGANKVLKAIDLVTNARYEVSFSLDASISERVIFPLADIAKTGIRDARFVKFTDEDGSIKYYATGTAYNDDLGMPLLLATNDFYSFSIMPLSGANLPEGGIGLFPKKVNGRFAMLSTTDGQNNYIRFSDTINSWDEDPIPVQSPQFPWEFVQLGNGGAPLLTKKGWLVITHGTGAMQRQTIGAVLLSLQDPTKVIAKLTQPLLVATETERDGHIPNRVYTGGAIVHNGNLILPYAMGNFASGFAYVSLSDVLGSMQYQNENNGATALQMANKKILIVEDDMTNMKLLKKLLTDEGYQIDEAADGLNALVAIGKNSYDLILSDITMPNFTGYQLLEFMQSKSIDIPVVFLSAHTTEEDEIKGLKLGAVEYLRKPVQPDLLKLRLKNILQ
jgi:CheY-like chemotaxis protein